MQISSVFLGAQPLPAQAIPRIIHQTFRSADLPERIGQASQSWISRNPEYDYRFHDDTICRMPLSGLLRPEDRFVSARAGNLPHAIYNGFICAAPAHPFLKAAIERAVRQVLRRRGRIDGYMATGPWNLGVAVNRSLGRAEKTHHLHGLTRSGQHDLRLLRKHPKTAGQSGFLSWEGKTVLLTEYPEYRQDLVASGLQHWQTTLPGKPPGLARSWLRKLRQLRL
jgi:hypothetical protein